MQRNQVEEFYRELDATNEAFVRNKFATGGYAGWRIKHVKTWLERREAAAKTKRDESIRFWTMVVGVTGVLALFVTAAGAFFKS